MSYILQVEVRLACPDNRSRGSIKGRGPKSKLQVLPLNATDIDITSHMDTLRWDWQCSFLATKFKFFGDVALVALFLNIDGSRSIRDPCHLDVALRRKPFSIIGM